ncbi:MAG: phage tail protein [Vulcanimicrobiaceae bacterium]
MAEFTANPTRLDPYKTFTFRVKWDGKYVPGISRVSGLRRDTETIEHRSGGDAGASRRSPGRTAYAPITIERGLTHDTAFEDWAKKVYNFGAGFGAEVSLKNFRKDIIIELYNEAGQLVLAYKVYRCWVSSFTALPALDANGAVTALESITLQNEGWERDPAVTEPSEPVF